MKIRLRSQTLRNSAAKVIQQHLEGMGVEVIRGKNVDTEIPLINWGVSHNVGLNWYCNWFNKQEALTRFINAGIRAPKPLSWDNMENDDEKPVFPLLARKVSHRRGNDIVKIESFGDLAKVWRTHDFFVPYIPKVAEYRTWVFRDEVVAVYEKRYQGKGKYDGVIWNHQGGLFKFVSLKEANWPKGIMGPSIMAVKSLHLDFGACDVMKDEDGQLWMLEVNTAPHIDDVKRKSGLMLAKRMYEWAKEFD
jgi:glutathione synthase/RimK-type ligase-like ATP-grasp enzyme